MFCLLFVLLLPNVVLGIFYPIRYHMYDKCGYPLDFQQSVLLGYSIKHYSPMPTDWDCSVDFSGTTAGRGIQVRFRNLNTAYASDCHVTRLVVADKSEALTPTNGVCGQQIPRTVRTRDNTVTITLRTDSSLPHNGDFDLLLTEFSYPISDGSCNGTDFKCKNRICISGELACNGYNDCDDNSDETDGCGSCNGTDFKCKNRICISGELACNGYNDCDDNSDETDGCGIILTVGVIAAIGAGGFCFLVLVGLLGVLVYRRLRRNNASQTAPPSNVWVTPSDPGAGYAKLS